MPPERARRPKGGGGPHRRGAEAAGSVQWHVMSPSRRPTRREPANDELAGWREPAPSLLDITLHWTRERRPLHRPGSADLDRLRRGRETKPCFPIYGDTLPPYAKRNVCRAEIREGQPALADEGLDDLDDPIHYAGVGGASGPAPNTWRTLPCRGLRPASACPGRAVPSIVTPRALAMGIRTSRSVAQRAAVLPIKHVGVLLADLPGELADSDNPAASRSWRRRESLF